MMAVCPLRDGPDMKGVAVGCADVRRGVEPVQVARALRVSTKSAYQWRRRWRTGAETALASKGPAAHGWGQDQRWTLARITTLIGWLFRIRYTLRNARHRC